MPAKLEDFDHQAWIRRLGAAIEELVAKARYTQVPIWSRHTGRGGTLQESGLRHYREMAALANTDPYAAKLFEESDLWLGKLPDDVIALLLEHPVLSQACSDDSQREFGFVRVLGRTPRSASSLVTSLAKLSARVGGDYAATLAHRFLAAGNAMRLHAHDVTVIHGLALDQPVLLGHGAYLASYETVRERFALPWDPEPWLSRSDARDVDRGPGRVLWTSSSAALVRRFRWGFAAAPADHPVADAAHVPHLTFRFPVDHRIVSMRDLFDERDALLNLLSIAVGSKLVRGTEIVAIPPWMKQLDGNIRTLPPSTQIGLFDVLPEDRTPSASDVEDFVSAARGWMTFCAGKGDRSTELAIRRTAAAFGIPGGSFGTEDRILDAAVALEAMYAADNKNITHKISRRAAWLLRESECPSDAINRQMKSFYRTRSNVVHGTVSRNPTRRERELARALDDGRDLARRSLFALLNRGPIASETSWQALVPDGCRQAD